MTEPTPLIRPYAPADTDAVVSLWTNCELVVPWNDPFLDIQRKYRHSPDGFLLAEEQGAIVGTVMAGYDGHRGWINYLAVCPKRRNRGLGTQLMQVAEAFLSCQGCPKINLQVRNSNAEVITFYKTIGYAPDDVAGLGKRLKEDG